jgi:hypothetical protein
MMGKFSRISPSFVLASGLALAGCGTISVPFGSSNAPQDQVAVEPAPLPEVPATIRSAEIVGRWGYAAYHKPEDRARTEASARGLCKQAVVINQGPAGGVLMYLADQNQLQELKLKGAPGGKNFIGPPADAAGGPQDREVVSFDGRVMLLRFTDPEVDTRYGTGVYVRCAPRA